jgi:dihydrofolate synthase/folylpolyglutamate synthase
MNEQDALDYLNSRAMFGIKLGLDNMETMLREFGNPHLDLQFVHLAGTNGKGSTGCLLNAGLMTAGKVGFYSSPHLIGPRERFRIDGQAVSVDKFTQAVHDVKMVVDKLEGQVEPTFFEVTTLLAILIFAEEACDFVIWETGMGGRLDSTNVVNPLVSIITNVGLDHTGYLGESLGEITLEKCGIIKSRVPVFYGGEREEVASLVMRTARDLNAPVYIYDRDFSVLSSQYVVEGMRCEVRVGDENFGVVSSLWGSHQEKNIALAVAVLVLLSKGENVFNLEHALASLGQAVWPGRLDRIVLQNGAELLIDGAHNVDAVQVLVESLQHRWPNKRWNVCLGILRDKDFKEFIEIIDPIVASYTVLPVDNERTLRTEEIVDVIHALSIDKTIRVVTPRELIAELKGSDNLLTGSLYLIGEVLREIYCGELPPVVK